MRISGVLPSDAPDPRDEVRSMLSRLAFPLMGLVAQPTIEDNREVSTMGSSGATAVSFGYTLWRNPDERDDPVNLATLDASTLASLEEEPPWPRPDWLVEQVKLMRYPSLSEAVRTSWNREPAEYTTLSRQLVDHANHILMNHFRDELGIDPGPPTDAAWRVSERSVNIAATLEIDGVAVAASEIDTDPFVYAIGAQLRPDLVTTVVIAREHLPYVRIALATRDPS